MAEGVGKTELQKFFAEQRQPLGFKIDDSTGPTYNEAELAAAAGIIMARAYHSNDNALRHYISSKYQGEFFGSDPPPLPQGRGFSHGWCGISPILLINYRLIFPVMCMRQQLHTKTIRIQDQIPDGDWYVGHRLALLRLLRALFSGL